MVATLALLFSLAAAPECACPAAVDALAAKLEANYVALRLDAEARERYEQARSEHRQRAEETAPERCHRVLQSLVAVLRDGHLFVAEYPQGAPAASAPSVDIGESQIRRALGKRSRRDPIEGIWYAADGSRYGITPTPGGEGNEFVAVVLETKVPRWRSGHVRAFFTALPDGSYDVTYFNDDHHPVHPSVYGREQAGGAAIRSGLLLHMPPHTWGREHPVPSRLQGVLDPKNPRAPTFRMHDSRTAVFFVPSHSPEHRARLETLIEENRARILAADTLIIDIRGDEGGSTMTTEGLEAFYRGSGPTAEEAEEEIDRSVILSSPDTIRVFEQMAANGWPPRELVERLKASPGKLVPLSTGDSPIPAADAPRPVPARPKRVAILIDRAVVSAGEAFVMRARNAPKVTIFGENSGGTIDYQTVVMTRFGCPELGFVLGYPAFAASPELPRGGVNATGIAPDVRIPEEVDPISFIAGWNPISRV